MNQEQSAAIRGAYEEITTIMKVGKAAKRVKNEVVRSQIQDIVTGEIEANHRFINTILKESGSSISETLESE